MNVKDNSKEEEHAFLHIAKSAFDHKNLETAISYYQKALEVNFENTTTHSNLALCYFKSSDYLNSLAYSEMAHKFSEKNIKAMILSSKSCFNLHITKNDFEMLKESKKWIEKSLELSKNPEFNSYSSIIRPIHEKIEVSLKKWKICKSSEIFSNVLNYYSNLYGSEIRKNIEKFIPITPNFERESLVCSITLDFFHFPVCTSTGHTYEKHFLMKFCSLKGYKCPNTNKELVPCAFYENKCVKLAVLDFFSKYPWLDFDVREKIDEFFI
jgi:tetratricopeptide (TPR) repeat protein